MVRDCEDSWDSVWWGVPGGGSVLGMCVCVCGRDDFSITSCLHLRLDFSQALGDLRGILHFLSTSVFIFGGIGLASCPCLCITSTGCNRLHLQVVGTVCEAGLHSIRLRVGQSVCRCCGGMSVLPQDQDAAIGGVWRDLADISVHA